MSELPFESTSILEARLSHCPVTLYGHALDALDSPELELRGFSFDEALVKVDGSQVALTPRRLVLVTLHCAGIGNQMMADKTGLTRGQVKGGLNAVRKTIDEDSRFEGGSSRLPLYLFATHAYSVIKRGAALNIKPR